MQLLRLILALYLINLLAACADFYESQPPAPILGRYPEGYPTYPPEQAPVQPVPQPPPVIVTKPLEGGNQPPKMTEVKPDFTPPPEIAKPSPEPTSPMIDPGTQPDVPAEPSRGMETKPDEPLASAVKPEDQAPPPFIDSASPPADSPPPPRATESYQPLESIGPQSPAVGSLVIAANENSQSGNYDSAVASIERAIRIEPRNAALYYKLSVLRLNQSKPRLAEDIARKAALLAGSDNKLKKHCWLLIANAREQQSNFPGAEKAKAEAARY